MPSYLLKPLLFLLCFLLLEVFYLQPVPSASANKRVAAGIEAGARRSKRVRKAVTHSTEPWSIPKIQQEHPALFLEMQQIVQTPSLRETNPQQYNRLVDELNEIVGGNSDDPLFSFMDKQSWTQARKQPFTCLKCKREWRGASTFKMHTQLLHVDEDWSLKELTPLSLILKQFLSAGDKPLLTKQYAILQSHHGVTSTALEAKIKALPEPALGPAKEYFCPGCPRFRGGNKHELTSHMRGHSAPFTAEQLSQLPGVQALITRLQKGVVPSQEVSRILGPYGLNKSHIPGNLQQNIVQAKRGRPPKDRCFWCDTIGDMNTLKSHLVYKHSFDALRPLQLEDLGRMKQSLRQFDASNPQLKKASQLLDELEIPLEKWPNELLKHKCPWCYGAKEQSLLQFKMHIDTHPDSLQLTMEKLGNINSRLKALVSSSPRQDNLIARELESFGIPQKQYPAELQNLQQF